MAASSRLTAGQVIGTIAWHEFITNLRRPGFIFFTLLIPASGPARNLRTSARRESRLPLDSDAWDRNRNTHRSRSAADP